MNVEEFRRQCPKLFQQAFAAGVASERKRHEAAELIAGSRSESQPPQINSPAMVVERSRQFKECVARSMMLRAEIAKQLAL
jgi:hypothetical protein